MEPVVAHSANPYLPATATWIYDQIRALKRYRPIILTQTRQNLDRFPIEPVLSAEDISPLRRTTLRLIRKMRGTYAGYENWLREHNAALIHAHFGQEGYRCLSAKQRAGIPLITTFYGLDVSALPRQKKWSKRYKRLFAEGDFFLVEGPFMGEQLIALGCPANRVIVQHLGVDLEKIPYRTDHTPKHPIVLTYSVFREKKGLKYAIRAFAKIAAKYPDVQLRMIGDGPLRPQLQAEIRILNLENRVKILGLLPHPLALEELKRATILLYPSVTASDGDTEGGAPVALIEAMAMGVPIVSSLHADIPEVVIDKTCGLLLPERDVAGLAEGLDTLLRSPEQFGRAGRAHVENQHNLQKQAEKLEVIYDRVVMNQPQAPKYNP